MAKNVIGSLCMDKTLLRKLVELHLPIADTGGIKIHENGINISTRTEGNYAIVTINVAEEDLQNLKIDTDVLFGVNFVDIKELIKGFGEPVCLDVFADRVKVTGGKYKTTLSIIPPSNIDNRVKARKFNLDNAVTVNISELVKFLEVAKKFGEDLHVELTEDTLLFYVDDKGRHEFEYTRDDAEIWEFKEPAKAMYGITFLTDYLKAAKKYSVGDHVTIMMSDGYPIVVQFSIADVSFAEYCLAPRVKTEL